MAANFNRIASFYDFLSSVFFGKKLIKASAYHLDLVPANARILIIGGGTGSIIPKLFEKIEPDYVLFLDNSEAMVNITKQKVKDLILQKSTKIEFRVGTAEDMRPEETFDVIITNFFLDLFDREQLMVIMKKLYNHLKTGGVLGFY